MDVILNTEDEDLVSELIISQEASCQGDAYLHLLRLLGTDSLYPPLATFLAFLQDLPGKWALLSPIHWQASHNDVRVLASGEMLGLGEEKALLLFSILEDFFKMANLPLHYLDAKYWLINIEGQPKLKAKALPDILQQRFLPHLSQVDQGFFWQRLLTEVQMFLKGQPSWAAESSFSALEVNGVWIWGQGDLTFAVDTKNKRKILCDHAPLLHLNTLGQRVSLISEAQGFQRNDIVWLQNKDPSLLLRLKQEALRLPITWHWNNRVYQTRPKTLWERLWRKK